MTYPTYNEEHLEQIRQRVIEKLKGIRIDLTEAYQGEHPMPDDEMLGFNQAIDQAIKEVEEI